MHEPWQGLFGRYVNTSFVDLLRQQAPDLLASQPAGGTLSRTEPHGVLVTAVNPGLVRTEGFPMKGVPSFLLLKVETVAEAIVGVVRDRIAPERSVPRFLAPFQLFRVITPPLYRWGIRQLRRTGHRSTPAR